MIEHFRDHLAAGKSSPGLLIVSQGSAIGLLLAVDIAAFLYSLSPLRV